MIVRVAFHSFLVILVCVCTGYSQSGADYSGYIKYMFTSTSSPYFETRLDDHLLHGRLNTQWYITEKLKAELDIRARAFYGDTKKQYQAYYSLVRSKHQFNQLDWKMWESASSLGYAQIDRLWIDYSADDLQATLGRQRIAWGTAFAWNIIDVFNPKDVLDFDYEELPGADAVRVQYYTGPISKVEAAYNPGETWNDATIGGLWSMNAWDYDFYLISGLRKNAWFAGGAWAGDIAGGGFRGEVLISESPVRLLRREPMVEYKSPFFNQPDPAVSAVVSGDYSFENSLTVSAEAMYNSAGVMENAAIYTQDALSAGLLSPSRWSVYISGTYQLHPLVQVTAFTMYNPVDASVLIAPQVQWSAVTNLDITVVAFFTEGKPLTEYGGYGDYYFLRGKWSF